MEKSAERYTSPRNKSTQFIFRVKGWELYEVCRVWLSGTLGHPQLKLEDVRPTALSERQSCNKSPFPTFV
jgi:hypothetical protein